MTFGWSLQWLYDQLWPYKVSTYRVPNDDASILIEYRRITIRPAMARGGGLGSRPKKMYGERLGDGVEYHLMKPTPRR